MIALLGASVAGDARIDSALKASVDLLKRRQGQDGAIPNNVDAKSFRPNFRAYADSGLWWIIGSSVIAPDAETCARVLAWYDCQDVDQSGLISMQEGSDWQDLFCTRGKGLYLNCLYVLALEVAARHADTVDANRWRSKAELARKRINEYFWYSGDRQMLRHIAHTFSTESPQEQDSLGRRRWLPLKRFLPEEHYYLPYLAFRTPGEWFDSLGHLLAILSGVASPEQTACIFEFIDRYRAAVYPMRSIIPVIRRGDPDWRDYYGMLNVPHHYHNGGIWPFIGGFYVAALVHAGRQRQAEQALERLAALNEAGQFNEWHHGETAEPLGVKDQAWSAGTFLWACECVKRKQAVWLA